MPTNAYGASKAAATITASALSTNRTIKLIILRPFHVFGQGEAQTRFWPSLHKAALEGGNFNMTLGNQVRDFIPVSIVAHEFLRSLTDENLVPGKPEIRNIGTGKPQSLLDFATFWWKKWGAKGRLLPGQIPYRRNEAMRYIPEI